MGGDLTQIEAAGYVAPAVTAAEETERIRHNLSGARAVVAFASAKGGVGKSAIIVNVAAALALKGRKVGIIDADIDVPSVAVMLGLKRVYLPAFGNEIDPASGPLGLRVVGSDLLGDFKPPAPVFADESTSAPVTNGTRSTEPTRAEKLMRLLGETRFGALDFVLVDTAPGVEAINSLARFAPLSGVVLLSHPPVSAVAALRTAVESARENGVRVLGFVENMTGFYCGNCHSVRPLMPHGDLDALSSQTEIEILARVPFEPRLAEACDNGVLFMREYADAPLAKQIGDLAARLDEIVGLLIRRPST
jgi:ATP-binding protein involved in chromosome partitioning